MLKLLLVFMLLLAVADSIFISSHGLRNIIRKANRAGKNFPEQPLQSPIQLNISDEDAAKKILAGETKRRMSSPATNTTANSTAAPTESTSKSPFDEPLFVPGDFLDSDGSQKFSPEIPAKDGMAKFAKVISDNFSEQGWKLFLLLLLQMFVSIVFLILGAKVLSSTLSLSNSASRTVFDGDDDDDDDKRRKKKPHQKKQKSMPDPKLVIIKDDPQPDEGIVLRKKANKPEPAGAQDEPEQPDSAGETVEDDSAERASSA